MNRYTVTGIYRDSLQPWVQSVPLAPNAMEAAKLAVQQLVESNVGMETSNIGVCSAFIGDYDDQLHEVGLLWWNEL